MPTEAVDTGMSDQELFDQANADEAPAEEAVVEVPEAPAEQEGQPRDEHGRFAGKPADEPAPVAEVQAEAPKPAVDDNAAMVPSWRVREINEEKRALADKVANFEAERLQWQQRQAQPAPQPQAPAPKVEKPDPLLDPEGYEKYLETKFEEKLLNNHRESSLAQAHRTYKAEFEEAYAAAQKQVDPALRARMQQSRDPGETLMQWHRERKTMAEVGTDPNAFFEKRFEAYLADPANQAKVLERIRGTAQQQPGATRQAPATSLPPSLTRATNASAITSADDDDISDEGLWRSANA
jgi:hypothetical protein